MKCILKVSFLIAAFLLPAAQVILNAQTGYKSGNGNSANMKLSGTSTMHKWEMSSKNMTSDAGFIFASGDAGKLTDLTFLSFALAVQSLKSGKSTMDKNAYKALKTPQYRNIVYRLTAATVMPGKNNKYQIKTTGNLSIAGVTKSINMDVYCILNKDLSITCTGSEKVKMTDYQVTPPSFMMGAMKTGNEIKLDFTMVYRN